ncbi:hypothetical protein ABZV58_11500 [Nocardia sp. NPDC004654]|uniref:hypothetical protein n=1 Tax=Nocardia sp. NPDC004654 TaxID=3154776 RepID=UPI0033ABDF51
MSLIDDIEQIAEQYRREMQSTQDELDEWNRSIEERGRELVERWEREAVDVEEKEEADAEARAEQERLAAEAREQREAIARSIAARKAKDVVTPIDEDDDPESEYYRRKSWLI